ncbi:fungal-specific transcription factor domain-containing protein [Amylocarpus encephaloides]|uniref:Fungal-specific transcription factor domain-containing protein n=1 Tax=Amylocarpus encephaloides TaxID=45428 RepID=A0A9P7YBG2_9HELO|nr:fungal-specific transcription factor domain-containing protein [Amylocarpus encephaloides]
MTPTPPSTTPSSAGGHSPDAQFRVVRKRNRVPLSCGPCRGRKLKCNRSHPCDNCTRRGDASSCSYAAPGSRKKNQSQGETTPDDMQNRIDRLEGLVLSLMTNGAQSAGPAAATAAVTRTQSDSTGSFASPLELDRDEDGMIKEEDEGENSETECVTNSFGHLKVDSDKGKSLYVGESHWHSVLADITEVKNYFISHKKELEKNYERIKQSKPSCAIDGPAFLFNAHGPVTDGELRGEVPAKSAVDKLVTRYFNSYDPAVHILHSPTFHKQLHLHWQDPAKTSIVWLGLLYSILCLAMQSYHKIGDEPLEWKGRTLELAAEYRLRTVQCLVNSDYTKSSIYTIETLILYVHGEYASRWDAEVGIWVICGMIVRLAMRMGYHRDPSNYAGIPPYQAEMRRRIWAFVRQMDTMFSFQLALPGMVRSSDCDAALPRNIFEDEFGPDFKVLPPARPFSEPTPVSYMIIKAHITSEFGSILEEVNAVNGKSIGYDDILKRDNRLRELKNNMPPHLRLRPLEECMHDPATLLMQRFNIDILWQKTMCVLHRKYISRAHTNPRYAHSRRAGVDASMEILRHQSKLHRESQPGGRMRAMKWFISSLTKHDYLLAAMIVCLDLNYEKVCENATERPQNHDPYFWNPTQRAEMLTALETSQAIWKESSEASMEAFKAFNILNVILEKLKSTSEPTKADPSTTAQAFAQFDGDDLKPEHSAAMTLGMLSGGLTPNSAAYLSGMAQSPGGNIYANVDTNMRDGSGLTPAYQIDNPFGAASFPMFNNAVTGPGMMDVPANLDWEAWDSFIQNGNGNIDPAFNYYPTSTEASNLTTSPTGPSGGQPDDPTQFDANNIFMGANTPGR